MSEIQKILDKIYHCTHAGEFDITSNEAEQALYDLLMEKLAKEIQPKIDMDKSDGGYDCCGCSTYQKQYDDTVSIINELFGRAK